MNSYRFMYLEEASLRGPTPRHVKRLQPITPEIPGKLAIRLDAWDFDQDRDRDRNPVELLDFESIRSRLSQLLDTWQEELRQCDDPDNPAWAELEGGQEAAQSSGIQSSAQIAKRHGAASLSGEESSQ